MNGDKEIYGSMNLLSSKLTAGDTFDKIGYESDFVIFHFCILILIVQMDTINEKSFSYSVKVIQRPYFFQCFLRLNFTELFTLILVRFSFFRYIETWCFDHNFFFFLVFLVANDFLLRRRSVCIATASTSPTTISTTTIGQFTNTIVQL